MSALASTTSTETPLRSAAAGAGAAAGAFCAAMAAHVDAIVCLCFASRRFFVVTGEMTDGGSKRQYAPAACVRMCAKEKERAFHFWRDGDDSARDAATWRPGRRRLTFAPPSFIARPPHVVELTGPDASPRIVTKRTIESRVALQGPRLTHQSRVMPVMPCWGPLCVAPPAASSDDDDEDEGGADDDAASAVADNHHHEHRTPAGERPPDDFFTETRRSPPPSSFVSVPHSKPATRTESRHKNPIPPQTLIIKTPRQPPPRPRAPHRPADRRPPG